ncbi:SulA-like leucine-rich domain-containing protein [Rheinheimera sp. WS51]|uniref:SulA-like leucine-rich domain-containing protein n=1 Tax=Rheinheimera sp. WS51 TaxID=3425886 RepID=UPI003D8B7FB8
MNYLLETPTIAIDKSCNKDKSLMPSSAELNSQTNQFINLQQKMLVQLIKQHQNQSGWIVLLAPTAFMIKLLASNNQLPLHKILVIHKSQLTKLNAVINAALTSGKCKVVINCSQPLTDSVNHGYQKLAAQHQAWFYPLDNLRPSLKSH